MSSQPERARKLFGEVLDRPAPERTAFLTSACGEDAELRRVVAKLLAEYQQFEAALPKTPGAGESPGDHIGPYKLLEVIGEGGFGTVWMAEQQAPIRRKVALKVVKWGMDTRQVVARFEAERQALALMDHPHIAKVFDGGATATGRPYFAMELVRGVAITRYCDEAKLTPQQRIELLVPVCEAVQHAHHKGVIHRDLKPSNVLVTLHDGKPVPKVIDFGIAKATAGQLTDKTVFTGFRQMLGTPEYMAPEQAEMSGLDIDTRVDVYSLGVLLYELLTGTKPFELKQALEAGWQELVRRIKEVDPEKPSTRVSTLGARMTEIAIRRCMLPKGLSHAFRGDLDWIVMKAMEKERGRRYETAHALGEDLQRHLRDEPVLAGPPGALYRLRKYVRRHRVGVAASAAIALALLAGAGAAGWGYVRAEDQAQAALRSAAIAESRTAEVSTARAEEQRQRALAEQREAEARTQADRAERIVSMLRRMLASADPGLGKGKDYRVRDLLADFEREAGTWLQDDPGSEAKLRATIGATYLGLGMADQAATHLQRSRELCASLYGEQSPEHASALGDWGTLLNFRGRYVEATDAMDRAIAITQAAGDGHRNQLADQLVQQAGSLYRLGRFRQGKASCRRAIELLVELRGESHTDVARARLQLARLLALDDGFAEAEKLCHQAVDALLAQRGENDLLVAAARSDLAEQVMAVGRLQEAETISRAVLATREQLLPDGHYQIAGSQRVLAKVLCLQGQLAAAEELLRMGGSCLVQQLGDRHYQTISFHADLGFLLFQQGRLTEAEASTRRALELQLQAYGEQHFVTARLWSQLGLVLAARDLLGEAEQMARRSVSLNLELFGNQSEAVASSRNNLAVVLVKLDQLDAAETLARQCLVTTQELHGDQHQLIANGLHNVGTIMLRRGRLEEAAATLERAVAMRQALHGGGHPDVAESQGALAQALQEQGKLEAADEILCRAAQSAEASLGPAHPTVIHLRLGQAECRVAAAGSAAKHPAEAKRLRREAEQILREQLAIGDAPEAAAPDLLTARHNLGWLVRVRGQWAEAEALLDEAAKGALALYGDKDERYSICLEGLAVALEKQGKLEQTIAAVGRLLDCARGRQDLVASEACELRLAGLLARTGDAAAAAAMLQVQLDRRLARLGAGHGDVATTRGQLGRTLLQAGKAAEAEPHLRASLEWLRSQSGTERKVASEAGYLAETLLRLGRPDEAETLTREAVDLVRQDEALLQANVARLRLVGPAGEPALALLVGRLARDLLDAGRAADAEAPAREHLAILSRSAAGTRDHHVAISRLGRVLAAEGKLDEAEPLLVEAATKLMAPGSPSLPKQTIAALVALYRQQGKEELAKEWETKLGTGDDGPTKTR